jgi:hypothetical protein
MVRIPGIQATDYRHWIGLPSLTDDVEGELKSENCLSGASSPQNSQPTGRNGLEYRPYCFELPSEKERTGFSACGRLVDVWPIIHDFFSTQMPRNLKSEWISYPPLSFLASP